MSSHIILRSGSVLLMALVIALLIGFSPDEQESKAASVRSGNALKTPTSANTPNAELPEQATPWSSASSATAEKEVIRQRWTQDLIRNVEKVDAQVSEVRIAESEWKFAVEEFDRFTKRNPVAAAVVLGEMEVEFRQFWLDRWAGFFANASEGDIPVLQELLRELDGEWANRLAWSMTENSLEAHGVEETLKRWSAIGVDDIPFDPQHAIRMIVHHGGSTASN